MLGNEGTLTEVQGNPGSSEVVASEKRRIGRPPQSTSPGGRAILLKSMQQFMRERPHYNFQRKEIAEFANVTPALISYYFPEKQDLVIEAASPVIVKYSNDISQILRADDTIIIRAESIIYKFIDLGLRSGYTIDYFLNAVQVRKRNGEIALLAEQYTAVNEFMHKLGSIGNRQPVDAGFLQSSIWGQCMYLSRQPHLRASGNGEERGYVAEQLTKRVLDLLIRGLAL